MKKNLFWMVAAALAFTGCSQDELVSEGGLPESGDAIAFSTYVGENAQSRATVVDNNTLKTEGFGVNAWYTEGADFVTGNTYEAFMTNTKVAFNEEKGWTYSPLKYWPNNKNHKVSFFAYGPYDLPENSSLTEEKTAINFTVESKAKDQVDLIYNTNYTEAMNRTKPAVNTRINFTFGHALARIAFSVEAAVDVVESNKSESEKLDGNTVINVKRVALVGVDAEDGSYDFDENSYTGPFYTKGTLSLLEPENEGDSPWSSQTGTQGFILNGENFYRTIELADGSEVVQLHKFNQKQPLTNEESYLMVIPQDLTTDASGGFKIYIEYDVITTDEDGNDHSTIENKIVSKDAMSVNFEQGMAYNFNLVLGMTSVEFDAEVTGWTDADDYEDEEWLPENDGEGESEEGTSAYQLVATTNLTHNGTNILIEDANDLGEARDLINAGSQYKFGEGEDNMVYKVVYANEGIATIDNGLMNEDDAPIVMPGGEGESEAEPTFPYFYEASYLQVGDVDLSAYDNWEPIGLYDFPFKGEYNVNDGYSISNLKINGGHVRIEEEGSTWGGLFGSIGGEEGHPAVINGITLKKVQIIGDINYVGGIAASVENYVDFSNCTVGAASDDDSSIHGLTAAGVVHCSNQNQVTVTNCENYATVTGENCAGVQYGSAAISSCSNYGNVTTSSQAAGVVLGNGPVVSIDDCHNYGDITSTGNTAGGVCNGGGTEKIMASHNEGDISGEKFSGAILAGYDQMGRDTGTQIIGCYNVKADVSLVGCVDIDQNYPDWNSEVKLSFIACYNSGANTAASIIGGYDDHNNYENRTVTVDFTNCYHTSSSVYGDDITDLSSEGLTQVDSSNNNVAYWSDNGDDSPMTLMNTALNSVFGFIWKYSAGTEDNHPLELE